MLTSFYSLNEFDKLHFFEIIEIDTTIIVGINSCRQFSIIFLILKTPFIGLFYALFRHKVHQQTPTLWQGASCTFYTFLRDLR